MYFSTVNPCMKYGGVMGVSKYDILSRIPRKYLPDTYLIKKGSDVHDIEKVMKKGRFSYPFILKPDVGERGRDVELIQNRDELIRYLKGKNGPFLLQEYIDYPVELGVFFARLPGATAGRVTSVVQKVFLTVTGDGVRTLGELITSHPRAAKRLDYLREKYKDEWSRVLPVGIEKRLEPIGNHCRGTTFVNANHLINDRLNHVFNEIASQIDGFYYGRFDLKVPSLQHLYSGMQIRILELNGVSSEIAHVYDPDYRLLRAWRDVLRHMTLVYEISSINHKTGSGRAGLFEFLRDLRMHLRS